MIFNFQVASTYCNLKHQKNFKQKPNTNDVSYDNENYNQVNLKRSKMKCLFQIQFIIEFYEINKKLYKFNTYFSL